MRRIIAALACLAGPGSAGAHGPISTGPPKFLGNVVAGEGPSWDPAGYLYFVGKPDRISRLDPDGRVEIYRQPAGGPGGALVDPERRLLVCESGARRVTRTERNGAITILADRYEGMRFNSPNDLALDSRGRVYFTDPRYGNRASMEMRDGAGRRVEGVYRVDAPGRVVRILTHELERPNGILVSPDDRYLYLADNASNRIGGARRLVRFDLHSDGTVDPASRKVIFDWGGARGPDGFKLDEAGRFYVAAGINRADPTETADRYKSGIYILSPQGRLLEYVPLPNTATNCAFGGADRRTLYVTAAGELWAIPMGTAGRISADPR